MPAMFKYYFNGLSIQQSNMLSDISEDGARLLLLLDVVEPEKSPSRNNEASIKGAGSKKLMTLDNVGLIKKFKTDGFGNYVSATAMMRDYQVSISEKNYPKLQEIASNALESNFIKERAEAKHLEGLIFDWLIECFQEKAIHKSLQDYIEENLRSDAKEYVFYFKVLALGIESEFEFGGIKVTHLSEKFIQENLEQYEKATGKSRNEIDDFFDEFKEPVLAVCKAFGVSSKAKAEAQYRVGLALSGLKIFFNAQSLSLADQMFDPDFRFNQIDSSIFIYESTGPDFDFIHSIHRTQGARPIQITNKMLTEMEKHGMMKLSKYISNPKRGSLYLEVTAGIDHFGKILSNRVLHDRVVQLISFFERFIIPKNSPRAYGQKRLRDIILPKIVGERDLDEHVKLINKFYNVRDKYLHNRLELPVNIHELYSFQKLAIRFLDELINMNGKFSELSDVYEAFGIQQ